MRPCAAKGCNAALSEPVWTRQQGRLDVCAVHRAVLADAGELADGPPSTIALALDPDAAHRNKIVVGMEAARERGVHVGRTPVPLPVEAVEEVRAGAALKTVAKKYGVHPRTLRRRADGQTADPEQAPEEASLSGVVEAIRTAHARRATAVAKRDAAARDVLAADADLRRLAAELATLTEES